MPVRGGRWRAGGRRIPFEFARDARSESAKTKFKFDDWVFLHDDNHLTARASLTKHGIELVTLSAFYERMSSAGSALDSPRNKANHDHVSEAVPRAAIAFVVRRPSHSFSHSRIAGTRRPAEHVIRFSGIHGDWQR
ncbi:DUF3833 family protein [Rhizobium wenxiniae]|uniref:DUF3833 family protein n=1 Tax=Rhizobium wenxiniae TaxID=1737357 RepID=UPI001C6DE243|nr:DUF3833 family protein [Rhizobium wenxiniae]